MRYDSLNELLESAHKEMFAIKTSNGMVYGACGFTRGLTSPVYPKAVDMLKGITAGYKSDTSGHVSYIKGRVSPVKLNDTAISEEGTIIALNKALNRLDPFKSIEANPSLLRSMLRLTEMLSKLTRGDEFVLSEESKPLDIIIDNAPLVASTSFYKYEDVITALSIMECLDTKRSPFPCIVRKLKEGGIYLICTDSSLNKVSEEGFEEVFSAENKYEYVLNLIKELAKNSGKDLIELYTVIYFTKLSTQTNSKRRILEGIHKVSDLRGKV